MVQQSEQVHLRFSDEREEDRTFESGSLFVSNGPCRPAQAQSQCTLGSPTLPHVHWASRQQFNRESTTSWAIAMSEAERKRSQSDVSAAEACDGLQTDSATGAALVRTNKTIGSAIGPV